MDYLREKVPMSYHDKVEKMLDLILSQDVETQVKMFNRFHEYIRLKYITVRSLQKDHPRNSVLEHNVDVFALCATSITYAKQCVLSNMSNHLSSYRC
jgi:hypothetical protein